MACLHAIGRVSYWMSVSNTRAVEFESLQQHFFHVHLLIYAYALSNYAFSPIVFFFVSTEKLINRHFHRAFHVSELRATKTSLSRYCSVAFATDLSTIKNEWGNAKYPVVPGHEIVGVVAEVGSSVARFTAGDTVGVGYIASTCRACANCRDGFENYCAGLVPSFNAALPDGATVHGGFAVLAVVHERYVVRIPNGGGASPAPLDRVAPLLCAGVTVYCPMRQLGLDRPGLHLGVAGLGGLGHLAVKFGKAFGVKVTVISTSPWKEAEAVERLGADAFLLSTNAEQMKAAAGTMDGIIDTVSAVHDLTPLITTGPWSFTPI